MKNQNIAFMLKKKELTKASTEADRISILRELVQLNPKDSRDLEQRTKFKKELEILNRKSSSSKNRPSNNPYDGLYYDRQIVLVGEANSGRSTLLNKLTGSNVQISDVPYTTYKPEIGTFVYNNVPFQIVELPPVYSGDNDRHKYNFLRNSDAICITARGNEDASSVQRILEDQLIIPTSNPNPAEPHKHRPKDEIIEKPALITSWSEYNHDEFPIISISSIDDIGKEIYRLLDIQRFYCFKNDQIEGDPLIFPLERKVTVKDFADKLGIKRAKGAKIYGSNQTFEGKVVGLSYVLSDGDKVWLK